MRASMIALAVLAPGLAHAAAYLDVCSPGTCAAADGTAQPAGTAFNRLLWDGQATVQVPAGHALVPDDGRLIYAPASATASAASLPATMAQVQAAADAVRAAIPLPSTGIPPAATQAGKAGLGVTFIPADAAPPSLTRSARVLTASDGSFAVTWSVPLVSASPVAPNPAPVNTGSQPITCNLTSVTGAGLAGKCWTMQSTILTQALVTAGVTLTPYVQAAGGVSVSLFAREPTP